MNDRVNTRDHNIELMKSLGYQKVKNTTVFQNGNEFILSPAVSEGKNGKYWFDIREVNLNQLSSDALLLVRIVPDLFILEPMKKISQLLSVDLMDNRPNSGNVWGINIDIRKSENTAYLYNTKKPALKIQTKLISKQNIITAVKELKKCY